MPQPVTSAAATLVFPFGAALADFYERAMLNGVIGVQKLRRHGHSHGHGGSHGHGHTHGHSHSHPHLLAHTHSHGHTSTDPSPLSGALDASASSGEAEQGSVHSVGGSDATTHRHTDSTHRNDSHPHNEYAPCHTTHIHLHNSHFHNVRAGCCW